MWLLARTVPAMFDDNIVMKSMCLQKLFSALYDQSIILLFVSELTEQTKII